MLPRFCSALRRGTDDRHRREDHLLDSPGSLFGKSHRMLSALLFGVVASSALVIGGVAGAYWSPPQHLVAAALAFASGALITALAFDLFEEAFRAGGAWAAGGGLLAGAAAFVIADELLDRYGGS